MDKINIDSKTDFIREREEIETFILKQEQLELDIIEKEKIQKIENDSFSSCLSYDFSNINISKTSLFNLTQDTGEKYINLENKNLNELMDIFLDEGNTTSFRVYVLDLIFLKDPLCNYTLDTIKNVTTQYSLLKTNNTYELLKEIVLKSKVCTSLKHECCKVLFEQDECYDLFYHLINTLTPNTNFTVTIDIFEYLFLDKNVNRVNEVINFFDKLICNSNYQPEYIFKILLSFWDKRDKYVLTHPFTHSYIYEVIMKYINGKSNMKYKVLAIKLILHIIPEDTVKLYNMIISFSRSDCEIDYNLRAECADVLLTSNIEEYKTIGKDVISQLGGKVKNVYDNKQNVHIVEIESSITNFLLKITTITTDNLIYNDIKNNILSIVGFNDREKVMNTLTRIEMDRNLYAGNQTLITIFLKIWKLILEDTQNTTLLKERLIEELIDMNDTCSSGHTSRLVNVLQGHGFNLDIGYKNQIQANVIGRMNKRIMDIKDDDKKYKILDEITWKENLEYRLNFNQFLNMNLMFIYDELKSEFVNLLDNNLFDEYFRNSLEYYENPT